MILKSPIAISISPNTQNDDVCQAYRILFRPWNWKKGRAVEGVERWFKDYFAVSDAVSFNSGRSALYAILKSFDIGKDDEVLLQAFTCVAVPDSVIWTGAKPIFVDIQDTFNIDPKAIEKHINKKTKAIIVQHTFGIPAQIEMIQKITQKYKLILIEDCAHSLGVTYKGRKIGTFGEAAFFSFGRDKVISSVFGGMAIISQKSKVKSQKLRNFQKKLPYPDNFWIFQQLLHPIVFRFILPLYNFFAIGKIILKLLQTLHLLSFPVYREEMDSGRPKVFPAKLPNALAVLALNQLNKLDEFSKKRISVSRTYKNKLDKLSSKLPINDELPFLRYPILTDRAYQLRRFAKKRGIILGDWYSHVVDPNRVNLKKVGYQLGSCPKAEIAAERIVNLPTYPRMTLGDIQKVINVIYDFFDNPCNTA